MDTPTKPHQTPEIKARRIRAYELYLAGRYSLREIALTTGVTQQTVSYWRKKDEWDRRIREAIDQVGRDKANVEGNLKALIRAGLYEKLFILRELGKQKPGKPAPEFKEVITAALAFVTACARIKDINPDLLDIEKDIPQVERLDFKDELPEAPNGTGKSEIVEEIKDIDTWLGPISSEAEVEGNPVVEDSPLVESLEQSPSPLSQDS